MVAFLLACKLQHHERLGNLGDEARQLAAIFATIIVNKKRSIAAAKAAKAGPPLN